MPRSAAGPGSACTGRRDGSLAAPQQDRAAVCSCVKTRLAGTCTVYTCTYTCTRHPTSHSTHTHKHTHTNTHTQTHTHTQTFASRSLWQSVNLSPSRLSACARTLARQRMVTWFNCDILVSGQPPTRGFELGNSKTRLHESYPSTLHPPAVQTDVRSRLRYLSSMPASLACPAPSCSARAAWWLHRRSAYTARESSVW